MSDSTSLSLISALNSYCFNTIWNAVHEEYRVNFALNPLHVVLQTSAVQFRRTLVALPTASQFMTYTFGYNLLQGSTPLPVDRWVNTHTLLNNEQVWLTVYDAQGRMLPLRAVWLLRMHNCADVIVAVEKKAMQSCATQGFVTSLFMTAFRGANAALPMQAWSYNPQGTGAALTTQLQTVFMQLSNALLQNNLGTIVVVNGYEVDPTTVSSLNAGDFIDIVLDMNVVISYIVALDTVNGGYQSSLYNGPREILHCPKASNPLQTLYTHNGATITMRDVATGNGVLIHRTSPVSVKQITHNDLSVDRQVINALMAGLNADQVNVVVRQRGLVTPHVLLDEAYYLKDLYLCDDDTIVQLLRGAGDNTLTFWQASVLEQSSYISLMFNDQLQLDAARLTEFVQALGYYSIGAILCRNQFLVTYTGAVLFLDKPFIYQASPVTVLVYKNGRKLPQNTVLTYPVSNRKQAVDLSQSSTVSVKDQVVVCMLEGGVLAPIRFTPSAGNAVLSIPTMAMTVYKEVPQTVAQIGYKRQSKVAYVPVVAGTNAYAVYTEADGSVSMTFYPALYGVTMIVQPNSFMVADSVSLDTMLMHNQPLVFALEVAASDGTLVPVLGFNSSDLYINGYRLVNGIDYVLIPLTDTIGTYLVDVVVCNQSFLQVGATGNVIDLFIASASTVSDDTGYVVNTVLDRTSRLTLWYDGLSKGTIEGLLQTNLVDNGVYMIASTANNGQLFDLQLCFPQSLTNALKGYSPVLDQQRLGLVDAYLDRSIPTPPAVIPVTQEHALYSPFITSVAHDLVNNAIIAVDDPNPLAFVRQFDAYGYLRARDPTLSRNNGINRSFVAINASYAQLPATSPANTVILQRLIASVLVTSDETLGDTLL